MANLISLSIDLKKIDKARLVKGKKGTYLNLTVEVKDIKDQFDNDVSCWEGQTKEEREAKKERNYLGNGRILWTGTQQPKPEQGQPVQGKVEPITEEDDLPF